MQRSRGRSLLRPVSVDDVVAEDVVTVERDTPITTAVGKMAEHDVGSTVVVEDDQPVGVLTDRTVALALEDDPNVAEMSAEELIDDDLISVDASTDIFETLQLMRDEGIRRLPVVDDDGDLQGIVTLDDALVLLGSELDKLATTVQEQSPRL
jgi:CBS domain-containing protein